MRSDLDPAGQRARTFTETARRAQIVAAAIDTIAEVGYAQASLARIAERIGTSKGLIAYHFDGKEELVREIVREVLAKAGQSMGAAIAAQPTGRGRLRAWIESNVAFMAEHRNHLIALSEIARAGRGTDGGPLFDLSVVESGASALQRMLTRFQGSGELRPDFDPQVMAQAIRATIDTIPPRLARNPDLDLEHYGRELANLFDRATRNPSDPTEEGQ